MTTTSSPWVEDRSLLTRPTENEDYKRMGQLGTILTTSLAVYGLVAAVFLILENRRPQATLAWMLA